jgi:hypothetical protein
MPHEWIKAALALDYVSEALSDYSARMRICERAHAGLIAAKAERIVWTGKEERDLLIGKGFWWAEGHEALEQDWQAGDFSTWIDQKHEVKAFGVSFDFTAISDLVPADRQATALRRISVIGQEDWISAQALVTLVLSKFASRIGTDALAEACRLGQLGARAMRATSKYERGGIFIPRWTAVEWDVPLWFWRDFIKVGSSARFEWSIGKVTGRGKMDGADHLIELQGLHFHRSGLVNLGLASEPPVEVVSETSRGRRPRYDWPAASVHIFGLINRGDFKPQCQADIEKALIEHLADGDDAPGESTVRPYAKLIWDENSKA